MVLREEVFHNFTSFSDVDSLRRYCTAFEAAHKDASQDSSGKTSVNREGAVAAVATPQPEIADISCSAATSAYHPTNKTRKCGDCGRKHLPRKTDCPARKALCYNCGKVGHLASVWTEKAGEQRWRTWRRQVLS